MSSPAPVVGVSTFKQEIQQMRALLQEDFQVSASRFYVDLISSALVGWGLLFFAAIHADFSPTFWVALTAAALAHYRALSFIHEVSHFRSKVPGIESWYNFLVGFWYGVPSYTHRTHADHHDPRTFGTLRDPEYAEWSEKHPVVILRPFLFSLLAPLVLTFRFCLFPLFAWLLSEEKRVWLFQRFSTFAMQAQYMRDFDANDFVVGKREELTCGLFLLVRLLLTATILPAFLLCQFSMMVLIAFLNAYRALVAHRYQIGRHSASARTGLEAYQSQALDSVTIEGSWMTELWAPISLRYHSLHHLFPMIPFHSLGSAHAKLKKGLPAQHFYWNTLEPSFFKALKKFYQSCGSGKTCASFEKPHAGRTLDGGRNEF